MEQLSAQDASFVYMESPNTPMHVGGVSIYDPSTAPGGKVRFKDVLAHFAARLHVAPGFRQKLLKVPGNLDHPYWVEDSDFDLEFHIRHIALPAPGDWRQLCIQVARLHARALDMNRPLWEFYVIEGLDGIEGIPKGCFAVVSKIHHAVVDGASGVEMTTAITSISPDAVPPPAEGEWQAEQAPGLGGLLLRTYFNNLVQPLRWIDTLRTSMPGIARLGGGLYKGELSLHQIGAAPRTRFNQKVGPHRMFDGVEFKLRDVKEIRKAVPGATINDVMLAVVGGALRTYLLDHEDLPDKTMIAMAPVSVRGENEKGKAGNLVSAMLAPLGTHLADPLERIGYVHAEANRSKALTDAVGARTLTDYSSMAPGALAALGARLYSSLGIGSRVEPMYNCIVTNVPGPPIPLYFAGARLVVQYGFAPLMDGVGLVHPIFSYCDNITVSFIADRDIMPDAARYAQCLRDSFAELQGAAQATTAEPRPAPVARRQRKPAIATSAGFVSR